jgi:hypothetical protein
MIVIARADAASPDADEGVRAPRCRIKYPPLMLRHESGAHRDRAHPPSLLRSFGGQVRRLVRRSTGEGGSEAKTKKCALRRCASGDARSQWYVPGNSATHYASRFMAKKHWELRDSANVTKTNGEHCCRHGNAAFPKAPAGRRMRAVAVSGRLPPSLCELRRTGEAGGPGAAEPRKDSGTAAVSLHRDCAMNREMVRLSGFHQDAVVSCDQPRMRAGRPFTYFRNQNGGAAGVSLRRRCYACERLHFVDVFTS